MFKVPLDYQCAIVVHAVTRSASSCPAMLGRLQELQEEGQPAKRGDRSTVTNSGTEQRCVKFRKESLPQSYGSDVGFDARTWALTYNPARSGGPRRSPGAIWIIEAAVASAKAVRCKSRKFCDSDTSPGFCGVSVLQKSDAKPSPFATSFATSEQGCRLEILGVCRGKLLVWPQMAPCDTTVGPTPVEE